MAKAAKEERRELTDHIFKQGDMIMEIAKETHEAISTLNQTVGELKILIKEIK